MAYSVYQLGSSKPLYDNSASTQKKRLVKYFENNPRLSTIEARDKMGILHPGGRINELRAKGYLIETHWTNETDANGVLHRVGLYVYQGPMMRSKEELRALSKEYAESFDKPKQLRQNQNILSKQLNKAIRIRRYHAK